MDRLLQSTKAIWFLDSVGAGVLVLWNSIADFGRYTKECTKSLFTPPFRFKETVEQVYVIGVQSTPVILFCVSFAAAVTLLEYAYHMKLVVQSTAMVPGFAALLILRELGAMLTALLLTSRVGAGIAAEVGSMKITEQIDALKLLNVDPIKYIVIPRLVACTLSSMAIVTLANAMCLLSLMVLSINQLDFSIGSFVAAMNFFSGFKDVYLALVKAAVFGAVIPIISCYFGFRCESGAEGVGHATTQAVVSNAVTIIILDFILTFLFSYLY